MLQLTTILFLISFSLLAAIHYLALKLFLYWRFEWFDIPMHFFGGAIVTLGIFTLRDLKILPASWVTFATTIIIFFIVALSWEAFEFWAVVIDQDQYVLDTVLDLVFGMVGAWVGYIIGSRLRSL